MHEIRFNAHLWPHVHELYRSGAGSPRHYFEVRVFPSRTTQAAAYRRLVARTIKTRHGAEAGDEGRASGIFVHPRQTAAVVSTWSGRGGTLSNRFAVALFARRLLTMECVSHEAVHVTTSLLRGLAHAKASGERKLNPFVNLGRSPGGDNEERFAYLVSAAVVAMLEGFWSVGIRKIKRT